MKATLDFKNTEVLQQFLTETRGAFNDKHLIEILKKQLGAEKVIIRQGGKLVISG